MTGSSHRAPIGAPVALRAGKSRASLLISASAAALLLAMPAYGATTDWTNGASNNNWFTSGNWTNGVPTATDTANLISQAIPAGSPAIIGSPGAVAADVNVDRERNTLIVDTGGTLNVSGTMTIGMTTFSPAPGGALYVRQGGIATIGTLNVGAGGPGRVAVFGAGAQLDVTNITIGVTSSAALEIWDGSVVNVNGGTGTLFVGAGGEISIGNGGTAGTINAAEIRLDASDSLIQAYHTGVTIAANITGAGFFKHSAVGNVVLTGNNTYSGITSVPQSGTLTIGDGSTSGTLGSGAVNNRGVDCCRFG